MDGQGGRRKEKEVQRSLAPGSGSTVFVFCFLFFVSCSFELGNIQLGCEGYMARYREKASFVSEEAVDLTPLIDCVFQLLIFFMVTTVFIHARGLDVDLPGASQATEQQEKKDINIVIERDGRIEIGGEEVVAGTLRDRIREAMEESRNDNVIIQADREVEEARVVEVVDAAKAVGVRGIAFAKVEGE